MPPRRQIIASALVEVAQTYGVPERIVRAAVDEGMYAPEYVRCTEIHDDEVMEMRAAYPDMKVKDIARKWGYRMSCVVRALTGRTHTHLPGAFYGVRLAPGRSRGAH